MLVFWAFGINIVLLALTFLYLSHTLLAILVGSTLVLWFFYFLWLRQNKVRQRVADKIIGQQVIIPTEQIVFRAVESSGYSQATGTGYIALTTEFLFFEFVLFDLTITVPIENLRGTELVYRLKGVSPGRKMLRIIYINEKGEQDSMAINVKDMTHWQATINRLSSFEQGSPNFIESDDQHAG